MFVTWFACKLIATLNSATKTEFRSSGAFDYLGELLNAKKVTALKPLWNKFTLVTGEKVQSNEKKEFGETIQRAINSKYLYKCGCTLENCDKQGPQTSPKRAFVLSSRFFESSVLQSQNLILDLLNLSWKTNYRDTILGIGQNNIYDMWYLWH